MTEQQFNALLHLVCEMATYIAHCEDGGTRGKWLELRQRAATAVRDARLAFDLPEEAA